jgi:hypothetical protein
VARGSTATGSIGQGCPYLRQATEEGRSGAERATPGGPDHDPTPAGDLPGAGTSAVAPAPGSPSSTCDAAADRFLPGPRQQALFCTTTRFPSCPRFPAADRRAIDRAAAPPRRPAPWAAGLVVTGDAAVAGSAATSSAATEAGAIDTTGHPLRSRPGRGLPLPTLIAAAILVVALVAAFSFTAMRGGIDLAAAPGPTASATPATPATTAAPAAAATALPASTPTAVPTAAATGPGPTPTVAPATTSPGPATPLPTASARPSPPPAPADPRYAGLKPCPDRPDCYLYVVRRGDTLSSIAAFFDVSLRAIRNLNADLENPSIIRVGQKIRVPGSG